MTHSKSVCFICNDETKKITYLCKGCSSEYCYEHLGEHRHELNQDFEILTNNYNQFQQRINEQKQNPQNSSLIEKINQWENESIEKIQQIAKECRKMVIKYTKILTNDIGKKFLELIQQLKQIRKENQYNEIDLNHLKSKLTQMTEEFIDPSKISIQEDSQKISITKSMKSIYQKWKQYGITIVDGELHELSCPQGFFIDEKNSLFITNYDRDYILEWKLNEKIENIIARDRAENIKDALCYPTDVILDKQNCSLIIADYGNRRVIRYFYKEQLDKQTIIDDIDCYGLAMDKYGFLYISDWKKNEVRRWRQGEQNGIVVAGGNGKDDRLNQLNRPTFIFVDDEQSIYISDSDNHRVMKWKKDAKEGVIVAGGNGSGDGLHQLSSPQGVAVDSCGHIYVVDYDNNRLMQWYEGDNEGTIIIGEDGGGNESHQLDEPRGLAFDLDGNIYIGDTGNDRIQKFERIC
ncbi:unnamed protein product [Adineta steineri]|uniref:Uncharacterized protein n=1 Tax=Adineta steineri TaxID=433720 RepID=A0A815VV36_9BILA|nr:unnamed protein product [Adineta steineri]